MIIETVCLARTGGGPTGRGSGTGGAKTRMDEDLPRLPALVLERIEGITDHPGFSTGALVAWRRLAARPWDGWQRGGPAW